MLIKNATIYINDFLITEDIDLDITSKTIQPGSHRTILTDIKVLTPNHYDLFDKFENFIHNVQCINITIFSLHHTYSSCGFIMKNDNNIEFILAAGEWS